MGKTKTDLHVSFASTDEAYFRTEVPGINETKTWTATGWKGERLNTMILDLVCGHDQPGSCMSK